MFFRDEAIFTIICRRIENTFGIYITLKARINYVIFSIFTFCFANRKAAAIICCRCLYWESESADD